MYISPWISERHRKKEKDDAYKKQCNELAKMREEVRDLN